MIRRYEPCDLGELLVVWSQAARIAHPFWTHDLFEKEWRAISEDHLASAETWVFEEEGRVVGFIALLGNEVGGIFVAPDWQGRGIGRALMDHALATRDRLELDAFEANTIGRSFYAAYGFVVVGRRTDEETELTILRLHLDANTS